MNYDMNLDMNLIHNFDIMWTSETILNSEITPNHSNLEITGHNMYCGYYHVFNCKRGSVCIFYKVAFLLRVLDILNINE